MKRLLIGIAMVTLAAIGWWHHRHAAQDAAPAHPPVAVSTAPASRRDMPMIVEAVGSVVPYETVAIRSRLDSQVAQVRFKDGDTVRKGDVLFVLDDRALRAQLGELEANVRRDQAQLENLRQQYERTKALYAKGFDSQAKLDQDRAAYEVQQATVGASQAQLQNVRVQLGYTRLVAPITGRTGTINITVGNTVKANDTQPLVTINQVQPIRVQAALPQNYFASVRDAMRAGTVAASVVQNGAALAEGRLEYIDNAIDLSSGTFAARARFENENETLWPGMFATLALTLGETKGALVIPEVALQRGQGGDYVFVIAGGKAEKRLVKVDRQQGGLAVIADGLKEGEPVATDGLMSLKNGSAVTTKNNTLSK